MWVFVIIPYTKSDGFWVVRYVRYFCLLFRAEKSRELESAAAAAGVRGFIISSSAVHRRYRLAHAPCLGSFPLSPGAFSCPSRSSVASAVPDNGATTDRRRNSFLTTDVNISYHDGLSHPPLRLHRPRGHPHVPNRLRTERPCQFKRHPVESRVLPGKMR
jgi:hypothetical protein